MFFFFFYYYFLFFSLYRSCSSFSSSSSCFSPSIDSPFSSTVTRSLLHSTTGVICLFICLLATCVSQSLVAQHRAEFVNLCRHGKRQFAGLYMYSGTHRTGMRSLWIVLDLVDTSRTEISALGLSLKLLWPSWRSRLIFLSRKPTQKKSP